MNELIEFLQLVEQLKVQKRTGWVKSGITDAESISDHMYRMAMISMIVPDTVTFESVGTRSIDRQKCILMSLVHDLAEAKVGDITPHCGVAKEEKHRLEKEAMEHICNLVKVSNSEMSAKMHSLWMEYEENQTPEAMLVHDIDKFEMVLQASQYEQRNPQINLSQFFTSTIGIYKSDFIRNLDTKVRKEKTK